MYYEETIKHLEQVLEALNTNDRDTARSALVQASESYFDTPVLPGENLNFVKMTKEFDSGNALFNFTKMVQQSIALCKEKEQMMTERPFDNAIIKTTQALEYIESHRGGVTGEEIEKMQRLLKEISNAAWDIPVNTRHQPFDIDKVQAKVAEKSSLSEEEIANLKKDLEKAVKVYQYNKQQSSPPKALKQTLERDFAAEAGINDVHPTTARPPQKNPRYKHEH